MSRINSNDTIESMLLKMSGGNPGTLSCMMELLKNKDGFSFILMLDTLELYDEKIYMLWNDCCNRDIEQTKLVLLNWQNGEHITKEEIHENLSHGYGKPFENLKSIEELEKQKESGEDDDRKSTNDKNR